MKKILIILPVVGDTKDSKRIDLIKKTGVKISAIAFERDYPILRMPVCEVYTLAKVQDGSYFKRFFIMISSLLALRKAMKSNDIVYAMSPDLAFLSFIAGLGLKKKLVIDVADIRKVQISNNLIGKVWRVIDKFITKKCNLLVVTAPGYITGYYEKYLGFTPRKTLLLENKVDYNIELPDENSLNVKKIRLGYFGVIRSTWALDLIVELLKEHPEKFEVLVAGIDFQEKYDLDELTKTFEGFNYFGEYKSPDMLGDLYSKIDINLTLYPDPCSDLEWFKVQLLSQSNRYYESLYFKKPQVAFSFSADGKLVERFKVGVCFNSYNIIDCIDVLTKIDSEAVNIWVNKLKLLPKEYYLVDYDVSKIKKSLWEL